MCSDAAVEVVGVNNREPELPWECRERFLEEVIFNLSNYFCIGLALLNLIVKFMARDLHIPLVPYPAQWSSLLSVCPIICAAPQSLSASLIKTMWCIANKWRSQCIIARCELGMVRRPHVSENVQFLLQIATAWSFICYCMESRF